MPANITNYSLNMESQAFSLDSYLTLLHDAVQKPALFYSAVTVVLSIIASLAISWSSQTQRLDIPFYGQDDKDQAAPRKRWMTDCLNLIREGYGKVSSYTLYLSRQA